MRVYFILFKLSIGILLRPLLFQLKKQYGQQNNNGRLWKRKFLKMCDITLTI
jgi:hypothetical protein